MVISGLKKADEFQIKLIQRKYLLFLDFPQIVSKEIHSLVQTKLNKIFSAYKPDLKSSATYAIKAKF